MENNITICIPTYNNVAYLNLLLASILKFTPQSIKILVFNDGSSDETYEYLKQNQIPTINAPQNFGVSHAYNFLVEKATTEYVWLLNDDMVVSPDWWKHPLNLLLENPNSIVCSTLVEPGVKVAPHNAYGYNCGETTETFDKNKFLVFVEKNRKQTTREHMSFPIFLSKKDFMTVGGLDARFTTGPLSDWDFRTKLSLLGREPICSQDSLLYHFSGKATRFAGNSEQQTEKFIKDENINRQQYQQKWGFFGVDEVYKIPIGSEVNGIKYPNPREKKV